MSIDYLSTRNNHQSMSGERRLAKRVGEVVKQALPHDPLKGHDFLSKAADKGYQVTGKMVAD